MDKRRERRQKRKDTPYVWQRGKLYVWSAKYNDYVHWFQTKRGEISGERFSARYTETPEFAARRISALIDKKRASQSSKDVAMIDSAYDRKRKWQERNGVSWRKDMERYFETEDLESVISTVRDVQILLSFGWEFEAEYDGYSGIITQNGGAYIIAVEKDGRTYDYSTDSLDEFGKNAMFGSYPLKEVVDKWTILFFA